MDDVGSTVQVLGFRALHLGRRAQLRVDDVICRQILRHLPADAGHRGVLRGDAVDDVEQLEALGQCPVPCAALV